MGGGDKPARGRGGARGREREPDRLEGERGERIDILGVLSRDGGRLVLVIEVVEMGHIDVMCEAVSMLCLPGGGRGRA
jgi:hypothetical protein